MLRAGISGTGFCFIEKSVVLRLATVPKPAVARCLDRRHAGVSSALELGEIQVRGTIRQRDVCAVIVVLCRQVSRLESSVMVC